MIQKDRVSDMCGCVSRRQFGFLLGGAMMTPHLSFAQDNTAIRALHGALDIDSFKGKKAARLSASAAKTIFTVGEDAFLTDDAFTADVEMDDKGLLASVRLLSGQALAVLKPLDGRNTKLLLPNATGSIRGTGFYVNVDISRPHNYICCCYGHISFQDATDGSKQEFKTTYHNATAINEKGDFVTPDFGFPYGHYDDELVLLESTVGRKPHWQLPDDKMHFPSPTALPVIG